MAKIGTYPNASTLTGAEELIGVQSAASVKLTPEDLRTYDDSQKVTGFVAIDLDAAGGGDYTTFAEVIDYLQTTEFKDAVIYVTVRAGTYLIPDSTSYRLKKEGINHLRFNGANKATTTIQVDDNEAGYYYALRFDGMDVRFSNITFTSIATTAPYVFEAYNSIVQLISCDFTGIDCLAYVYNSYFKLSSSSVTSALSTFDSLISGYQNSYIDVVSAAVDNNSGGWIVYEVSDGSTLTLSGTCSISNSDGGIDVYGRSFVYVDGTLTFTNMASYEYNVETDIIQKDGSYVSTGNLVGPFPHQNLQTGTTYTLTYADMGAVVEMTNVSANAVTIPDNSSVPFPVDSRIEILQRGAGTTTVNTDTDTLTGGAVTLNAGQSVVLWKRASTEWVPLFSLSSLNLDVANEFDNLSVKATPIAADRIMIEDSADSFNKKYAELTTLLGGAASGGFTPAFKNSNYTASSGDFIYADSSPAAFTIDLPATPSADDFVVVVDVGSAGVNNVTVARNGSTIAGASEDFVIDQNFGQAFFIYDGTTWQHALIGFPNIINVNESITGYGNVRDETGTTYGFVLADAGQLVTFNNAGAVAATIPANASVAFEIGTRIDVFNKGAGDVTIGITTDTLSSTDNVCQQGKAVTLLKVAATEWWVIGGTA